MRAFLVAVDYADMLSVTLPYNLHHFEEVTVVTTKTDTEIHDICDQYEVNCYQTDAFYHGDSVFNKWRALEECLDVLGRDGLICLMDADVLWPSILPIQLFTKDYLYTPRRRMMTDLSNFSIPPEDTWEQFPLHRQEVEFAGYSQIFFGNDKHLPQPPWHEINWRHAGGADSFFQQRWPSEYKIRPPFEVLHLGNAGENWCGRASQRIDGSYPENAKEKKNLVRRFIGSRTRDPQTRFNGEKYCD